MRQRLLLASPSEPTHLYNRGVQCRTLVRADLIGDAELYKVWEEISRCGEQFRSLPSVPMQMHIADADLAVVPVHQDQPRLGAIFIRERTLIDLMIRVFDHFWLEASPILDQTDEHATASRRADRVLEMIAAGATDDAISRALGVGVRTIRRDVAELRQSLGVGTRTEIVAAAIRQGWL